MCLVRTSSPCLVHSIVYSFLFHAAQHRISYHLAQLANSHVLELCIQFFCTTLGQSKVNLQDQTVYARGFFGIREPQQGPHEQNSLA